MKTTNQWHSTTKRNFAVWRALWKVDDINSIKQDLLTYMETFFNACEENEVLKIQRAHLDTVSKTTHQFEANDTYSYLDFVFQKIEEENQLYFFPFDFPNTKGKLSEIITSKVNYFDEQGQVVSDWVSNVQKIMLQSHPYLAQLPSYMKPSSTIIYPNSPITLKGRVYTLEPKSVNVSMRIKLNVDIWFPYVHGFPTEDDPHSVYDTEHDNSILAKLHTPRFNNFIRTIHKSVLDLGGEWHLESDYEHTYRLQIDEYGILWDLDPDEFHEQLKVKKPKRE